MWGVDPPQMVPGVDFLTAGSTGEAGILGERQRITGETSKGYLRFNLSRRSSVVEQPIRNRLVGSSNLPVGSSET